MIKGYRFGVDWKLLGAELARKDDAEQAEFFKGFVEEAKTYGTNHQTDMQMASIGALLTREEKEILQNITYISDDERFKP